ncbi:hypothetical protein GQ600_8004 [Phytophthora cactorum]|nr:hypothetical protein GQ600_8004 [Phytophthora cactorum]
MLADSILRKIRLSSDDLQLLRENQAFTKDPCLALAYCYCCGAHPDAFAKNDESLIMADCAVDDGAQDCLHSVLDTSPGANEKRSCQESVAARDLNTSDIYACASCSELIICKGDDPVLKCIDELSPTFLVAEADFRLRYGEIDADVRHSTVRLWNGEINFTISTSTGYIVLCRVCAHDPREVDFSLANGHDYVRCDDPLY